VLETDVEKVKLVVSDSLQDLEGSWLSKLEIQALMDQRTENALDFLYTRFPSVSSDDRREAPSGSGR
jgi:hypothetical protein